MFKKIILAVVMLSAFAVFNSSFAAFEEPNPRDITVEAYLGVEKKIVYTLYRNAATDRILGFINNPVPPVGSILTISQNESTCLTQTNRNGRESCAFVLNYTNARVALGLENPISFTLSASGVRLPLSGFMSFTANVIDSFQAPAQLPEQESFIGVAVPVDYTFTRLSPRDFITSITSNTAGLVINTNAPPEKNTCRSAGTTGTTCTLALTYTSTGTTERTDTVNFAIETSNGVRVPVAPTLISFDVKFNSTFQVPAPLPEQSSFIGVPANIEYTLTRRYAQDYVASITGTAGLQINDSVPDDKKTCRSAGTTDGATCTLTLRYTSPRVIEGTEPVSFVIQTQRGIRVPADPAMINFNVKFSDSFQDPAPRPEEPGFAGVPINIEYTLTRGSVLDFITGITDNTTGLTINRDVSADKRTCLIAGTGTGGGTCILTLTYTNPQAIAGLETVSFALRTNNQTRIPRVGLNSFTINYSSAIYLPDAAPQIIHAVTGETKIITYQFVRQAASNVTIIRPLVDLPVGLNFASSPGTCLLPPAQGEQNCTVVLEYTNPHTTTGTYPVSFALQTNHSVRVPLAPSLITFNLVMGESFQIPSAIDPVSAFVRQPINVDYTLTRGSRLDTIVGLAPGSPATLRIDTENSVNSSCLRPGAVDETTCTLRLIYTNTLSQVGTEKIDFGLATSAGTNLPASFTANITDSFLVPDPLPRQQTIVGRSVDITYHLIRMTNDNTIIGLVDQTNGLSIKTEGSSCLEAATGDVNIPCNLILTYFSGRTTPGSDLVSFALTTNHGGRIPLTGTLSFNVDVNAIFAMNSVRSIAAPNDENGNGPSEAGTGVKVIGMGFSHIVDSKKIELQFISGTQVEKATSVTVEDDELITANAPKSPIVPTPQDPLPYGRVDVRLVDISGSEPVVLVSLPRAYEYREPYCTSIPGMPGRQCSAKLQACIFVPRPVDPRIPTPDRTINVTAEKVFGRCVDTVPNFKPIEITGDRYGSTVCTPADDTYIVRADRTQGSCNNITPANIPQWTLRYTRADDSTKTELVSLRLHTMRQQFDIPGVPPVNPSFCLTNKSDEINTRECSSLREGDSWHLDGVEDESSVWVLNTKSGILL